MTPAHRLPGISLGRLETEKQMRIFTTSILTSFALVGIACSDGSAGLSTGETTGPSTTTSTTSTGTDMTTGTPGAGGSGVETTGMGGSSSTGAAGDTTVGAGGMATTGSGGAGGMPGDGGGVKPPDSGSTGGKSGPFHVLVLSKTLEFRHDSIETGWAMLTTLGMKTDAQITASLGGTVAPNSQFDIKVAADDLSDFLDLSKYELIFWENPTGTVFTSGGANGATGKTNIQKFIEAGGAWVGVHSATDFEKTNGWAYFQDQIAGGWFDHHDGDGTPGSIVWQPAATAYPMIVRNIMSPWSCTDEWYYMNRSIENVPGFKILGKLASDQRPAVWLRDTIGAGAGRAFYTIRGHNKTVYAEPKFQTLVHAGILWATKRLQ
jgi:hypothetical protein